jgi:N-succinyldiaminopimelate aminotransferase
MEVHRPAATYFVVADIAPLGEKDGRDFCLGLPARSGVVAVPASAFYDNPSAPRPLVRFAFCKRLEVLEEAARRLALIRNAKPPRRR